MPRKKVLVRLYDQSISSKKNYIHLVKQLKNGKQCHLRLYRREQKDWFVSLCIADNAKQARKWNNNKLNLGITGDGSLEGLLWAKQQLITFATMAPEHYNLRIQGSDIRRLKLYIHMIDSWFDRNWEVPTCHVLTWCPDEWKQEVEIC